MKIRKKFSYVSKKIIWRILFSESNKMIIEERDSDKREVFFSCLNASDGAGVFKSIQLEEKFWIGIEIIYKDIIIFHKFGKPDMPGHKGIIAYDINSRQILWQTEEYAYQFIYNDNIYVFKNAFDNRYFYSLDVNTGKIIDEVGADMDYINSIRNNQYNPNNSFKYIFPEVYRKEFSADGTVDSIIKDYTGSREISGNIEYILIDEILLFNFYSRNKKNSLINDFFAVNLNTKKVFEQTLNENANAYTADSFFIKDNILYLLKDKNSILAFELF